MNATLADKPPRHGGIARNALANSLAFGYVIAVNFFLSPFIINHLGSTVYGVWTLLAALVGYLGLLDFGIRGAVTRHIAYHHATAEMEQCSAVASAALAMYGILGAVAIVFSCVAAYLAPNFFSLPQALVSEARVVLCIGGLTVATVLVGAVFGGTVTGLERFDIVNGIEILLTTLRSLAIVVALVEGMGLVALAVIQLGSSILSGLASWAAARRVLPDLRISLRAPLRAQMRVILGFSMQLSALHILGAIISYSAALIIAAFLSVTVVTMFAIASNLCDYARQVASTISNALMPRISALTSVGSGAVGQDMLGAARLATLVTAPIAAIFLLRGESFINLWMGPDFGPQAGEVLRILAIGVLLVGARQVAVSSIIGMNRHRALIMAIAIEATSCLALSIALVGPLGLVGVGLGLLIPSAIVNLAYIPRQIASSTGISARQFYRDAWMLPLVACLPFAAVNAALELLQPATSLLVFFGQVISTLPLVLASAVVVCLNSAERKRVYAVVRSFSGVARGGGVR